VGVWILEHRQDAGDPRRVLRKFGGKAGDRLQFAAWPQLPLDAIRKLDPQLARLGTERKAARLKFIASSLL